MAPLPQIDDVYRVALNWLDSSTGTTATNVMHFRKPSSNPAAVWSIVDAHLTAAMWGTVGGTAAIKTAVITPLDGSSASLPVILASGDPHQGHGGAGEVLPNVAAVVKLLTAKRGRSYRGRQYLPFTIEAAVADGRIVTSFITAGQSAWTTFLAAMVTGGADLVIASYKLATYENVVAVVFESWSATQRRRLKRTAA